MVRFVLQFILYIVFYNIQILQFILYIVIYIVYNIIYIIYCLPFLRGCGFLGTRNHVWIFAFPTELA